VGDLPTFSRSRSPRDVEKGWREPPITNLSGSEHVELCISSGPVRGPLSVRPETTEALTCHGIGCQQHGFSSERSWGVKHHRSGGCGPPAANKEVMTAARISGRSMRRWRRVGTFALLERENLFPMQVPLRQVPVGRRLRRPNLLPRFRRSISPCLRPGSFVPPTDSVASRRHRRSRHTTSVWSHPTPLSCHPRTPVHVALQTYSEGSGVSARHKGQGQGRGARVHA
jgi:hypothetical protein